MNNDASWVGVLHDVFRRERSSLLQYVSEAFPWARPDEQAAVDQVQKMIEEERQGIVALTQFLRRRHLPLPYLGAAFPMSYTNIHFVSLDFMLPLLVEHSRQAIGALERDIARVHDAEPRTQLERLLDMKRRHLQQLEDLAKSAKRAHA